jgi:hypothetical protein
LTTIGLTIHQFFFHNLSCFLFLICLGESKIQSLRQAVVLSASFSSGWLADVGSYQFGETGQKGGGKDGV